MANNSSGHKRAMVSFTKEERWGWVSKTEGMRQAVGACGDGKTQRT